MQLRDAQQVAQRVFILNALVASTFDVPKDELVEWLQEENLWNEVTESEKQYLNNSDPSEYDINEADNGSEAMAVLLWSLGYIAELPYPDEPTSLELMLEVLPELFGSTEDFINNASLKDDSSIYAENEKVYKMHWEVRDAYLNDREDSVDYHPIVVMQRHKALNWLCLELSAGQEWDEVTTDT